MIPFIGQRTGLMVAGEALGNPSLGSDCQQKPLASMIGAS